MRKSGCLQVIFLWASFFAHSVLHSQTYNFENFSVEDGLAQNQILSMCQDNRGYIWFGTNNGGISIYNGTGFKTMSQVDGLVNNVVYSIIQSKNGNLIFGTNGGLSVYNGFEFKNFSTEEGLPHNRVFSLLENENGEIWLGTNNGVAKLIEEKITAFSEDKDSVLKSAAVFSMYRDSKGNVWFGTLNKGAYKFGKKDNRFTNYSLAHGLDNVFVRTFVEDKEGNIWIGTIKGLNKLTPKNQIVPVRFKDNETQITVTSSLLAKDGTLWFGTLSGLDKYNNLETVRYTEANNGLISNSIWTILEDREGNLWIGTQGKGVAKFRFKGELFRNYSVKNNLPNDQVQAIYQDRNRNYWIGSDGGVAKINPEGEVETFHKNKDGIKLGQATNTSSIIEDNEGRIWMGTRNFDEGCYVFDGKGFSIYSQKDGFSHNSVHFIMKDKKGVLWFGTKSGVTRVDGKTFNILKGIEEAQVWWILEDHNSHFWFATDNGVIKYDGNSLQYFTKKDGLVDGRVRTIVQDKHRIYWFATDEGLFSYDSNNFNKIDQTNGLSSNTIYSLLLDGKYSLWAGTNKGLNRLNIDSYYANREVHIKHYGKAEGFIGLECNGNAVFKDRKGHLWFGTVKGATVFSPEMETVNTNEPLTHITNIRLDFENYNWSKYCDTIEQISGLPVNLVLPYNKNHLTFDFVGVSLTIPQKVKYQYKLEPIESAFTPPTYKNEAVYPHLPPGEYKFVIKAKNNDDYWNNTPVEYKFTILPPWYKTWWFYSLCVLAIISSVWSFIIMREKNLKKQKIMLETQVRDRTAELRKEKEKVEKINLEVIEKNKIIEHKNKDITDSITYAMGIQQAILPPDDKFKKFLPDSFILFRPRDIVSGDFYWMEVTTGSAANNQFVLLAVCDCTGHGVPGGFVSMVGHNGLTRTVNEKGILQPSKILDSTSMMVEETFLKGKRKDGMDAVLCRMYPNGNSTHLEFAAANNPLYLVRKKENGVLMENDTPLEIEVENDTHWLYQLNADKQPVGAYEFRKPFTNHCLTLLPGDTIYLSSDGFRDQFGGPKGKKFMAKNFKQILISLQSKSMDEQKLILDKTIEDWMSGLEQNDDICIVGVRV